MIIIADSSPIISLAQLQLFQIFKEHYQSFVIPGAVYEEIKTFLIDDEYAEVLKDLYQRISLAELSTKYEQLGFGEGETQCLILYEKLGADAILLDDREARTQFESRGVHCLGTLAILIEFRSSGIIPNLNSVFKELLKHRRFFSRKLLNTILREFKESEL